MGVRRIGAVALVAMLAAGLGACSDDGGDDGGDVALEDVDDGSSSDDEGTEDTDGSDEGTDDTVDLGDLDFGSEECQEIFGALSGLGAGFADPDGGELDFGVLADLFDELADEVPDIEDDLSVMADAYREFSDRIGPIDFSDPDIFTSSEFAEASEAFNDPAVQEATTNVSEFFDDACNTG
jgi:hypothetical protein